jgi:hypothetical protein
LEQQAPGGGEQEQAAEIVSVDHHFPAADTSSEVTNEGSGGRERVCGVEAEARRARRAMASRMARLAALRGRAAGREDRAAVRIQAFYRGYLVRTQRFVSPAKLLPNARLHEDKNVYAKIEMYFENSVCFRFWKTECVMAETYATVK